MEPDSPFKIGEHLVEPSLSRVTGPSGVVRLEPKAMLVLVALAKQPGKLVSKDALLSAGWSDRVVVEGVLKRSISLLRRTLGDDPRSPRIIETIPRKGYRLVAEVSWPASDRQPERRGFGIPTVAVLPFSSYASDTHAGDAYFADGMTEMLIAQLGKLAGLRVISRTSAMRFRQSERSLPAIAAELGADAIVEGAVWVSGERFRITAQLIDPASDHHRWAETYDRKLEDVLQVQSEVTQAIAAQIRLSLSDDQRRRIQASKVNVQAYDAYLRGNYFLHKRSANDLRKALQCFQEALAHDQRYAPAHVGLADTYIMRGLYGELPPVDAFPEARAHGMRALALDDDSGDAHGALAAVALFHEWNFETAELGFARALALGPNQTRARLGYADMLSATSRHDEALAQVREILLLDPLDAGMRMNEGDFLTFARRFDQALGAYGQAAELDDNMLRVHVRRARCLAYAGHFDAAIEALETARSLAPDALLVHTAAAVVHGLVGSEARARSACDELRRKGAHDERMAYALAECHAAAGDTEPALQYLAAAISYRSTGLVFLAVDPVFDRLRGARVFAELLGRVGLAEE